MLVRISVDEGRSPHERFPGDSRTRDIKPDNISEKVSVWAEDIHVSL